MSLKEKLIEYIKELRVDVEELQDSPDEYIEGCVDARIVIASELERIVHSN